MERVMELPVEQKCQENIAASCIIEGRHNYCQADCLDKVDRKHSESVGRSVKEKRGQMP